MFNSRYIDCGIPSSHIIVVRSGLHPGFWVGGGGDLEIWNILVGDLRLVSPWSFQKWEIIALSKFENWAYYLNGLLLSFRKSELDSSTLRIIPKASLNGHNFSSISPITCSLRMVSLVYFGPIFDKIPWDIYSPWSIIPRSKFASYLNGLLLSFQKIRKSMTRTLVTELTLC